MLSLIPGEKPSDTMAVSPSGSGPSGPRQAFDSTAPWTRTYLAKLLQDSWLLEIAQDGQYLLSKLLKSSTICCRAVYD